MKEVKNKYIEVIDKDNGICLRRMDASDMSDNSICRIVKSLHYHFSRERYKIRNIKSSTSLDTFSLT